MSAPGWYPDPRGDHGVLRFWDGRAWTPHVSSVAYTSGNPPPRRRHPWGWLILAMVLVAGLVTVLILRPLGGATVPGDDNSARPTGSQWNEVPPTAPPSQPDDTGGQTVDCPDNSMADRSEVGSDGRLHGGGLSFEAPGGDWVSVPVQMPWLYDHNSTIKTITPGWMSNLSVGEVLRSEGFPDPRSTATQLMACLASSGLYLGFSGRDDLVDQAFTLDAQGGWRITANVFVDNQGDIAGDVVDVIVLDLGDPRTLAVFISCATIDLESNLDEVARATASLRVE